MRSIDIRIQQGEQKGDPFFEADLTFTTIDQLLSSYLFHPLSLSSRLGNINAGALVGSLVVFDEYHLLEPERSMATSIEMLDRLMEGARLAQFVLMTATIAYREWVYHRGTLTVAIDASGMAEAVAELVQRAAAHINYLGKRGCFWQFCSTAEQHTAGFPPGFTLPAEMSGPTDVAVAGYGVSQFLDDFGESLCKAKDGFERISTYGAGKVRLSKDRVLVPMLIPCRRIGATRSYTHYRRTAP